MAAAVIQGRSWFSGGTHRSKTAVIVIAVGGSLMVSAGAFFHSHRKEFPATKSTLVLDLPPAVLTPSGEAATVRAIQSFVMRTARDPEDCRSQNALAGLYLERLRQTGREDYLLPALDAARVSLATVGAERNLGGLSALSHAEFANHDFVAAREHAIRWTALQPNEIEAYAVLGDTLLELGDYDQAREAFQHLQGLRKNTVAGEARMARLSFLYGGTDRTLSHFALALRLLNGSNISRETIAWFRWQLGETTFSVGDYESAERHYIDALIVAPDYFRALASLGRLRAGRGDFLKAINYYERAIRISPAPEFMAALGDLYQLSGRGKDAHARFELVEQLAEHSQKVHGQPFNRQLALFYADHDMKPEEAYALAKDEYAFRQDIYGADALAWTALKSGRLAEAEAAARIALRLGTRDARLFYHAGMIAHAMGKRAEASKYLQQALTLNPLFDPGKAEIARKAIKYQGPLN